jgi:hypothetical protein
MPSMKFGKRIGPVGMALTAWDIWRRIPPQHRKLIIKQARTHGPRIAARVINSRKRPPG